MIENYFIFCYHTYEVKFMLIEKNKKREYDKKWLANLSEEKKKKINENKRKRYANLSEEKKEKRREYFRKYKKEWYKNSSKESKERNKIKRRKRMIDILGEKREHERKKITFFFKEKIVYILNQKTTDFYKIGRTSLPIEERIKKFKTGSPFEIICIYFIRCELNSKLESKLHKEYLQYRVRGEWFNFTSELLEEVKASMDSLALELNEEFSKNSPQTTQ